MKTCKHCAEEIQDDATICKHCRKKQNGRDMNKHVTILGVLFIPLSSILCVGGIILHVALPMEKSVGMMLLYE